MKNEKVDLKKELNKFANAELFGALTNFTSFDLIENANQVIELSKWLKWRTEQLLKQKDLGFVKDLDMAFFLGQIDRSVVTEPVKNSIFFKNTKTARKTFDELKSKYKV